MPPPLELRVDVLRLARGPLAEASKALFALAILVGIVGALALAVPVRPLGTVAVLWGAALAIAAVAAWLGFRSRPRAGVPVVADRTGLRLGGQFIPREGLTVASITHGRTSPLRVSIERRWRPPIELAIPDREAASALVDALRLGHRDRTLSRRIVGRFAGPLALGTLAVVILGGCVGLVWANAQFGRLGTSIALPLWLGSSALAIAATLWPARVTVGADGVRETWLGLSHATPLREIRRVEVLARNRTIELSRIGPSRTLRVLGGAGAEEEAMRLAVRVQALLESWPPPAPAEVHAWLSEHAGAAPAAWVQKLRSDRASYREAAGAPFGRAALLRALDDSRGELLDSRGRGDRARCARRRHRGAGAHPRARERDGVPGASGRARGGRAR